MENHRYTLYLDESGTAEFTDHRKPETKYLVISAIILDSEDDSKLSGYFEYLKKKHGLMKGTPFHSYDIFENKKSGSYLPPRMAKPLINSLIEFFKVVPLRYKVVAINKENCRKFFGINENLNGTHYRQDIDGTFINSISYTICSADVFRWFGDKVLNTDDSRGTIIAESRDRSDKAVVDALLDCKSVDMYSRPPKKRAYARECDKELTRIAKKIKSQITGIKFETKIGECPGLELADLISYISFLKLENRLDEFKSKKLGKLWTEIKSKMDKKKIKKIDGADLTEILPRNRVRKISKFVTRTSNI